MSCSSVSWWWRLRTSSVHGPIRRITCAWHSPLGGGGNAQVAIARVGTQPVGLEFAVARMGDGKGLRFLGALRRGAAWRGRHGAWPASWPERWTGRRISTSTWRRLLPSFPPYAWQFPTQYRHVARPASRINRLSSQAGDTPRADGSACRRAIARARERSSRRSARRRTAQTPHRLGRRSRCSRMHQGEIDVGCDAGHRLHRLDQTLGGRTRRQSRQQRRRARIAVRIQRMAEALECARRAPAGSRRRRQDRRSPPDRRAARALRWSCRHAEDRPVRQARPARRRRVARGSMPRHAWHRWMRSVHGPRSARVRGGSGRRLSARHPRPSPGAHAAAVATVGPTAPVHRDAAQAMRSRMRTASGNTLFTLPGPAARHRQFRHRGDAAFGHAR